MGTKFFSCILYLPGDLFKVLLILGGN